uniref:ABC transporter substrate-binding protein n=1 Tax=Thermosporothrix sp. COM3 TaxID=2490863 RepID=A0A455SMA8_9CHLR|nr:ABC transporter substrate-binding protein [Thermosporothrix sp. COM3]
MSLRRSPMRKYSYILLGFLALLVVACGGGNTTTANDGGKAPENRQVLVQPMVGPGSLKTLDPPIAGGPRVVSMLYTGLVQLDENLQVIDQLAQTHEVASDGVTWTFKLKPNLKFSNGDPLTSEDVVYSIDRALQPATKAPDALFYLRLIKDADKLATGKIKTLIGSSLLTPDPQTVKIITSKKASHFLYALAYETAFVVNKKVVEKYGSSYTHHIKEGAGAGPYILSEADENKAFVFVPNPNYNGPKPQIKKVIIPFYKSQDTMYQAYQTGEVSYTNVPPSQLEAAQKLPNNQFYKAAIQGTTYYTMNYLIKPFDNQKVRQAFALALDKEQIARSVYKDTIIPTNHIVPQGANSYNPNLKGPAGVNDLKGDKAKAKALFEEGLKEEGLSRDKLPPITLSIPQGDTLVQREAVVVQQMWNETLDLDVRVSVVETSKYYEDMDATKNNPHGMMIWRSYWKADYADPQNWLTLLFDKESTFNNENYGTNNASNKAEQQKAIDLMYTADANFNQDERIKQYQEAEQMVVDHAAWIPLFQMTKVQVRKPCVKGMINSAPFDPAPDNWSKIYISNDQPCISSRYTV